MTHPELIARLATDLPARAPSRIELSETLQHAAVLVLLLDRGGDSHIPLIVRAHHLSAHPGHVALPGGRVEPGESARQAAVRETEEELGIPPDSVRVLGELDDIVTSSGFAITPVVATNTEPLSYRPDPGEVASVFEAPLSLFADPSIADDLGQRIFHGYRYAVRAYHYDGHRIWGATARVLEQLAPRSTST